jgi:putative DNA primase/helicase
MTDHAAPSADWAAIMEAAQVLKETPTDEQEYCLVKLGETNGAEFAAAVRRMLPKGSGPARPLPRPPSFAKPAVTKPPLPPVVGTVTDVVLPSASVAAPAKVEAATPSAPPLPATPAVAGPSWNRMAAIAKAKAAPAEAEPAKAEPVAARPGAQVQKIMDDALAPRVDRKPFVVDVAPTKPVRVGPEPKPLLLPLAAPILSLQSPLDSAREFITRKCRDEDGNQNLHFWQGQFYQWSGTYYRLADPTVIEREVLFFIDSAQQWDDGRLVRFLPKPSTVRDIMFCLEKCLALDKECQPPAWLPDGDPARDIIAFRNRAVNMRTGESAALGSDLWIHNVLEFDWSPTALAAQWLRFLGEVFPNDKESQDFLEEWMGYCMTEEIRFQKAAMFIGPKRSGKGTITHIIRRLVGEKSYCSLNFSHWTATENSQQVMLGKRVGVFPDVRLKSARSFGLKGASGHDPGGLSHTSQGLLLTITGGDPLTVGRKNTTAWEGQLRLKLMLISNEIPSLNDSTGALPSRFIKLKFGVSFFGREDIDLLGKLEAELPGIAVRCVAAYQRLCKRGRFIQPASGEALERAVLAQADPFAAFIFDHFRWNPESIGTPKAVVRNMFEKWCSDNGRMDLFHSVAENKMGEHIIAVEGFEHLNPEGGRPIDPATGRQGQRRWIGVELVRR